MKVLHTADWQIGESFGQFDEAATFLASARIESVKTLASLANEHEVDIVVVAGDVFDQQTVQEHIIRRLFAAMDGYKGRWVLLPGNHDAALVESVWTRALKLDCIPANVTIVLKPQTVFFDDLKLALLCAPLTQRHTYEDTTAFFDMEETPDGYFRIGLAHGAVEGILPEEVDSPNPISSSRAETARLDYLALGDWHGTKTVNSRTWYSGAHEPDRFKDNDPGNALVVTVTAPGAQPSVMPVRVGKYTWHRIEREISVSADADLLADVLATFKETDAVRVRVNGTVDMSARAAVDVALHKCRAQCPALRADVELTVLPSEDEIAALLVQGGYVAKVAARLQNMRTDPANAKAASDALVALAQLQKDVKEAA